MSLDKYVMRGFTSSLGSGEGKWVASSAPPSSTTPSPNSSSHHSGGTSFVLGGLPTSKPGRSQSNSQGGYTEDRYSFNPDKVQESGTVHERHSYKHCFQATSCSDGLTSTFGKNLALSLCFYGIALGLVIFVIYKYAGNDHSERWYSTPANVSRHARPLWDR